MLHTIFFNCVFKILFFYFSLCKLNKFIYLLYMYTVYIDLVYIFINIFICFKINNKKKNNKKNYKFIFFRVFKQNY